MWNTKTNQSTNQPTRPNPTKKPNKFTHYLWAGLICFCIWKPCQAASIFKSMGETLRSPSYPEHMSLRGGTDDVLGDWDEMRPLDAEMSWLVSPAGAVGGWLNHGSRWNQQLFQNGGVWWSHGTWLGPQKRTFRNFFLQFDVMRLSSAVREIQYAMHVACMSFVFTYCDWLLI